MVKTPVINLVIFVALIQCGPQPASETDTARSKEYLYEPLAVVKPEPIALAAVGEPTLVARFQGTLTKVELPQEPLQVIPVDPDAHFALHVRVLELQEGALPGGNTKTVNFLIHSPSIFFFLNLGKTPKQLVDLYESEYVFVLTSQKYEGGRVAYDLSMRPALEQ